MAFKPPQKAKRDANEPEVFDAFRAHGISVCPTDKPLDGILAWGSANYLIEVKDGPKARLTKDQKLFLAEWPGEARVIRSVDEAIAFAREIRGRK